MLAALIDEHIASVSCNRFRVSYPCESFLIIPLDAVERREIAAQNNHRNINKVPGLVWDAHQAPASCVVHGWRLQSATEVPDGVGDCFD
jgi:hypothetical protein